MKPSDSSAYVLSFRHVLALYAIFAFTLLLLNIAAHYSGLIMTSAELASLLIGAGSMLLMGLVLWLGYGWRPRYLTLGDPNPALYSLAVIGVALIYSFSHLSQHSLHGPSGLSGLSLAGLTGSLFLSPVLEEVLFRGIFLENLLKKQRPLFSILFTALLFGVLHLSSWHLVLSTTLLGVFLGFIYYKSRSVMLCILCHAWYNFLAVYWP